MKTIIRSEDLREKIIVRQYPATGFSQGIQIEQHEIQEFNGISGTEKRTALEGALIVERELSIARPYMLEVEHDFPFLKMQFEMLGYSNFISALAGVPAVEILGGTHRLFFLPEVRGRLNYRQSRTTLEINLTLPFFNRIFAGSDFPIPSFGQGLMNHTPVLLHEKPLPILPAMRYCIEGIRREYYTGALRKIHLEAKITELLLMQIHQVTQPGNQLRINPADRDKLYYVKELIEGNLYEHYTILQLAELAGMNDCKLKRLFKAQFGLTLFEYLTEVRLTQARQWLEEGKLSVDEIASRVGYRYAQHFAAAFRRKFGANPKAFT